LRNYSRTTSDVVRNVVTVISVNLEEPLIGPRNQNNSLLDVLARNQEIKKLKTKSYSGGKRWH
jgi:hypothetical protein